MDQDRAMPADTSRKPPLLSRLVARWRHDRIVEDLFAAAAAQSRLPAFYGPGGVPDTPDGRFELLALHVYLLCDRLQADGADGGRLAQRLVDRLVTEIDRALREIGFGDQALGKRVPGLMRGLPERWRLYREAIAAGHDMLAHLLLGARPCNGLACG
jgi:cytochrome b pre-mRNA-processing protein 3